MNRVKGKQQLAENFYCHPVGILLPMAPGEGWADNGFVILTAEGQGENSDFRIVTAKDGNQAKKKYYFCDLCGLFVSLVIYINI